MSSHLQLSNEIKKINEVLAACQRVNETIGTKGWQEIIEPLIDKMINDITGGKTNGRWYSGLLDRAKKDERREFYIGYKQALIDLHRRVYGYADNVKLYEEKREELIKQEKDVRYTQPMIDDTRYGKDAVQK